MIDFWCFSGTDPVFFSIILLRDFSLFPDFKQKDFSGVLPLTHREVPNMEELLVNSLLTTGQVSSVIQTSSESSFTHLHNKVSQTARAHACPYLRL